MTYITYSPGELRRRPQNTILYRPVFEGYVSASGYLVTMPPNDVLEPPIGTQTVETVRYSIFIPLFKAVDTTSFIIRVIIGGIARVFVDIAAGITYNYKVYAKLQKTADYTTFTDLTPEGTAMNYSRAHHTSPTWVDDGPIRWDSGEVSVSLAKNEVLGLRLRGTSWASSAYRNGNGIRGNNLRLSIYIL